MWYFPGFPWLASRFTGSSLSGKHKSACVAVRFVELLSVEQFHTSPADLPSSGQICLVLGRFVERPADLPRSGQIC